MSLGNFPVQWTFDTITANAGPDSNGNLWWVTKETGWSGGAPARVLRADKPWATGSYRVPNFKSSRVVALEGITNCATQYTRRLAEHQLASIMSNPQVLYPLSCSEETGTLSASVEVDGTPLIAIAPGGYDLVWSVTFAAPDPRKYGLTQTAQTGLAVTGGTLDWTGGGLGGLDWTGSGIGGLDWGSSTGSPGSLQIVNNGTADTWPVFTISANGGSITNPSITDVATGNVLSFSLTLSGSDTIVITTNPIGRSVILNGTADRRPYMSSAQWWSVPAGQTYVEAFGASSSTGSPLLSASYSPAFW